MSVDENRGYLKCDSLAYLSHEGLLQAAADSKCVFCQPVSPVLYPIRDRRPLGKFQHENNRAVEIARE
jgi:glutamine phosphoribosylpyrophosphate amidotransferase